MPQMIQAKDVTLRDLTLQFGLQFTEDEQFFREWQDNLPEITDNQKQFLDKVRTGFLNLILDPPLLEKTIQITILGPLLFIAEFFLAPFQIKTEQSIEISAEDEGMIIRGQIDILLVKEQLWVVAIESKRFSFSVEAGLAQLLAYMLANPHPNKPGFGLIVTGGTFMFVKLIKNTVSEYGVSRVFALRNRGNELYEVFRILKHISQL
jgi:hypothetical protein